MNAEIIAVGTELLLGDIVNTNAQYLSVGLAEIGIDMYYQSVVGDNLERLVNTINTAIKRSDIVLITGGLGPTPDDLSKEAAAKALGLTLQLDVDSLNLIQQYFKNTGRTMSESNKKQAYFPKERCTIFPNAHGTAPGCVMTAENGSKVFLMPGVPSEMKHMFDKQIKPYLMSLSNKVIFSKNVVVAGIGESALTSFIPQIIAQTDPTVSPYCKPGIVTLRVTSSASTINEAEDKCNKTVLELQNILGKNICGINISGIEQAVVNLLSRNKLRLATAESCTAGKISAAITSVSGASSVFDFGASTYSNQMKQKLLSVEPQTLQKFGAVSAEVAAQMSNGVREYAGADLGLSVTGVAGPGQTENKPAGLVYISLADGKHTWVEKLIVGRAENDRERVRNSATVHALDLVRRYLEYLPETMPRHTDILNPITFSPEEFAFGEINPKHTHIN